MVSIKIEDCYTQEVCVGAYDRLENRMADIIGIGSVTSSSNMEHVANQSNRL